MSHPRSPVDAAQAYLTSFAPAVDAYLATLFPEGAPMPARLREAMNYSLLAGGKRLRPVLCLATARTFGVAEDVVMPAAAAIELVHCYSLIHDDLPCMDDDDLRRGRPTNHKVFGEATALLAGDALLTYAFEQLAQPLPVPPDRQMAMVRTLAHAAGCYGMVGGQMADLEAERRDGTPEDLAYIHTHKTAKLIQAAVLIGSWFADVAESVRDALARFGLHAGWAFQIMDDWLDVAGDAAEMGKARGSDERLQKLTYPRLFGLAETRRQAEAHLAEAVGALAAAGIDSPLLVGLAQRMVERQR
ncbi:farnesyl-diphosphate synthase [Alicyclobacillus cellulosilyticus]|uniref:Farnesyl diphosphate synthase n=1 Tax=Alicyclobacillus cellulosilyticus TaxID=1003997 RepID=A0A917K306_9BACL|nr:farnesyl diphosphate synthase [Alicyclobacillus cellulosilyticus]GGI95847.1 farnesyl-diphosphate synthase [Alicyclobacillus cellulosilyticus]